MTACPYDEPCDIVKIELNAYIPFCFRRFLVHVYTNIGKPGEGLVLRGDIMVVVVVGQRGGTWYRGRAGFLQVRGPVRGLLWVGELSHWHRGGYAAHADLWGGCLLR